MSPIREWHPEGVSGHFSAAFAAKPGGNSELNTAQLDRSAFETLVIYLGRGVTEEQVCELEPLASLDPEALSIFSFVETGFSVDALEAAWNEIAEGSWRDQDSTTTSHPTGAPHDTTIRDHLNVTVLTH